MATLKKGITNRGEITTRIINMEGRQCRLARRIGTGRSAGKEPGRKRQYCMKARSTGNDAF